MKKTKQILFTIALVLSAILAKAQTYPTFNSPEAIFDSTIYDLNGTRYFLNDIKIDTVSLNGTGQKTQLFTLATCTNSYFNVYFEPTCGMASTTNTLEMARRDIILQLFCDLSAFITNKGGVTNKVNILVKDINNVIPNAFASNTGALSTPYFSYPYAPTKSGIIDSEIWKTIISGQDSYAGIASPLIASGSFYHGMITFNYANTSLAWHENLSTSATGAVIDLYSIALHEIGHTLGFSSGIKFNGSSSITSGSNYYTRYDQFLKTQGGTPLVANTGTCSLYNFSFNTSTTTINPNTTSCTSPNTVSASNSTASNTAIWYASNTVTVPVYTPNCFEPGPSLSHFEDTWAPIGGPPYYGNDAWFVMSNFVSYTVPTKRYYREEERKVFCNIGYSVAATYGTPTYTTTQKTYTAGACAGISVAGINDGLGTGGIYTYTTNVSTATGTIQPLTNDVGVSGGSYECLEVVVGAGTLSNTSGNISTPFTYNPSTGGLHLLRYVPVNGSVKGGITYIYVKVLGAGTCSVTPPNNCEMVYNGNFEANDGKCGFSYANPLPPAFETHYSCWDLMSGCFWNYVRNCTSSPYQPPTSYTLPSTASTPTFDTWNGSPNNSLFFSCHGCTWTWPSNNQNVLLGNLTASLAPSSQYKVSFWIKEQVLSSISYSASPQLTMHIVASPASIISPLPLTALPPPSFTIMSSYAVPRDEQWHNYSAIITYTGSATKNISFLTSQLVSNGSSYLFDDFSILPASAACTFTVPPISCTGTSFTLNPLVSIPNGTFTGPGVSLVGSNYEFNTGPAGLGLKTIAYTYTTPTGCTLTAYAQTSVTPTPTAITVITNPPAGLCPSYPTATVTASGATTYTFTNGVSSIYTNPAIISPPSSVTFTVIGANATCSLSTTMAITVGSVCVCVATNTVASSLSSTTLNLSTGYALTGAVTITSGSVLFSNVDMRCSPGASIIVANNATLTISQSHLYSCFDMWNGIIVQNGGRLLIIGSLIEDALNAVDVTNNTSTTGKIIDISNSIFNKNYTGISINTYTQTNATTYTTFSVTGSLFTCRTLTFTPTTWPTASVLNLTCTPASNLATPYCIQNIPFTNLKAPYSSESAQIGISLITVGATTNPSTTPTYYSIQIGDHTATSKVNVFDNLFYGIWATDANVKSMQNVFQNSQYKFVHGTYFGGIGIEHRTEWTEPNTYLLIKAPAPYTLTRNNKFYDCTYAIRTGNVFEQNTSNALIQSTQTSSGFYQRGKYGIYSTTDRFKQYDINNCYIYNIENPIVFNTTYGQVNFGASSYTNTQYAGIANVNYNTIAPVPSGAIGSQFVSNAITTENVLSSGSTSTLLTGSQVNIAGNVLKNIYRGIYSSNFNSPSYMAQGNTCTLSLDPSSVTQNGISIIACTNPSVQLNSILGPTTSNTITTGIYASMNNTPKVTCNTVSTTYQGFEFANNQPGTKWKGNSMTTHTLGMALTYTGVIGAQGSASNPIDNTWNGTWTGSIYHTSTNNSTVTTSPLYTQSGTIYNPTNNTGLPLGDSYWACCTNTTTGAYSCAGGGARMMNTDDVKVYGPTKETHDSVISSARTITNDLDYEKAYLNTLEDISEYKVIKGNVIDPSNYIAQYQLYRVLDNDISYYSSNKKLSDFYYNNKISNYGKLLDGERDLGNGNYSSATSVLSSISSKNNIETNYSDFANLYSKYYLKTFVDIDNTALKILANKCPFTEGEVVYQARALYNIINSTVELFNDNCPLSSSSRLKNNSTLMSSWIVNLYPNPASSELFINTNNEKEELKITITDVNGRLVADYNSKISGFNGNIKLNMISGIYFVTLVNQNNDKVVKKLVITQ